jgi:hypothetical protein
MNMMSRRAPGFLRHAQLLFERKLLLPQRREHQVGGHQLGEGSRLEALVGFFRGEDLAAGDVGEHPGAADDLRRLRCLRKRQQRQDENQYENTDQVRRFAEEKAANYSGYRTTIIGRRLSSP